MKRFRIIIKVEEIKEPIEGFSDYLGDLNLWFKLKKDNKTAGVGIACTDKNPEEIIKGIIGEIYGHLENSLKEIENE